MRDGYLGAVVPDGWVTVPGNVSIENGYLQWDHGDYSQSRSVIPKPAMFDDFVELWNMDDEAILRFAKAWGPLRIDDYGNPLKESSYAPGQRSTSALQGRERIEILRFLSRRAYSILRISSKLESEKRGDESDWAFLSTDSFSDDQTDVVAEFEDAVNSLPYLARDSAIRDSGAAIMQGDVDSFFGLPNHALFEPVLASENTAVVGWRLMSVKRLRIQIAAELTIWMHRYTVGLAADWTAAAPKITITYRRNASVLPAIALHLALAVLRQKSLFTCDECGKPYSRTNLKRPKRGDLNFCEDCAGSKTDGRRDNKASNRLSQRKLRENKQRAMKLAGKGASPEDISHQLSVKLATIQNWIKPHV